MVKHVLRPFLPQGLLAGLRTLRRRRSEKRNGGTAREIFTRIYERGAWGTAADPAQKFYSGVGSHEADVVERYVEAVTQFIATLGAPPTAVDLGCGDFSVGSRIYNLCSSYVACDVVEALIEFDAARFQAPHLQFRTLDITRDELPAADVAFIRQVLQHLSNKQIAGVLSRLHGKYKYLVISEHIPSTSPFVPNIDKPTGADVRINVGSGVVLTEPPFRFAAASERELCRVRGTRFQGEIRTVAYSLVH